LGAICDGGRLINKKMKKIKILSLVIISTLLLSAQSSVNSKDVKTIIKELITQKEEIKEIVKIQVNNLKNILKDKNLTFSISDNAVEWLANKGFDQEYGARPLKRAIQKYIQNPIANLILDMKDKKLDQIKIDVDGDQLVLNNKIFAIN
jgi:ATP-dependent Clp protease ATP-binding subunit ClpB